jgi:hypothetical protein
MIKFQIMRSIFFGLLALLAAVTAVNASTFTLLVSSTALWFDTQYVGTTSNAQSLTLSNDSTTSIAIGSISVIGDFSVAHNCRTGLGVGGFCTLNVAFSPTAGVHVLEPSPLIVIRQAHPTPLC